MPGGFGGASDQSSCPCGGGVYRSCCGPLHRGDQRAETAEQLMRSRYSAFARGEIDYLLATHPESDVPAQQRRRSLERSCRQTRWLGLTVLACLERNVPLITVENPAMLSVTADALGLSQGVLQASSYSEAAGLVLALREGLSPASLGRPLPALQRLD